MSGRSLLAPWRLPLAASCLLHLGLAWGVAALSLNSNPPSAGPLYVQLLPLEAATLPKSVHPTQPMLSNPKSVSPPRVTEAALAEVQPMKKVPTPPKVFEEPRTLAARAEALEKNEPASPKIEESAPPAALVEPTPKDEPVLSQMTAPTLAAALDSGTVIATVLPRGDEAIAPTVPLELAKNANALSGGESRQRDSGPPGSLADDFTIASGPPAGSANTAAGTIHAPVVESTIKGKDSPGGAFAATGSGPVGSSPPGGPAGNSAITSLASRGPSGHGFNQAARPSGGYQVRPSYPSTARRLGVQGTTLLRVRVRADGQVGEVKIHDSAGHPDLDQAAADAVRRWRFEPARRGAEAVAMWVLIPVEFRLK